MCLTPQLVKPVLPGLGPAIQEDDNFTKSKRKAVSVNKDMQVITQDRSWKVGTEIFWSLHVTTSVTRAVLTNVTICQNDKTACITSVLR